MPSTRPSVLITGIADGLGKSLARIFAAAGYDVIGLSRSDRATPQIRAQVDEVGGTYTHLFCDLTDPTAAAAALQPHADRVMVLVHNAQTLLIKPGSKTSIEEFEAIWRVACLGAMVAARSVLPAMTARGEGALIFSGATAALRAGGDFAAFASAKFALRGMAQALSRECGPKGIHIAHVVLDGLIDAPQTDRRFGPARATRMDPEAVAQAYLDLAQQSRTAWTHELDLRPFDERF
jgi:NAD(P)-dependent dehydrogenase (short-subunit alcohol dehydrogenase family)